MRFLIFLILLTSCSPSLVKYSSRNPDLFLKPSDKLEGYSRGRDPNSPTPEIYVKKKKVNITPKPEENTTGSLYDPEHEGNFLFTQSNQLKVGRYVNVSIKPVLQTKTASPEKADSNQENIQPQSANNSQGNDDKTKSSDDDLLKALPHLAPSKPENFNLAKEIKMEIIHKFPNGDILVRAERSSSSDEEFKKISTEARIPYEKIASGEPITTDDLLDVDFIDATADETIQRQSSGWTDEYTLRYSGFSEAKSKLALELEDQRSKLNETKTRLEDRIKSLAAERQQIAKAREEWAQKKLESEKKLEEAKKKLDESSDVIESQKQTIEEQQESIKEIEEKTNSSEQKESK